MIRRLTILFALWLALAGPSWAALTARYVTPDSDGGDGSSGNPWTLTEALTSAAAGDWVKVLKGTYTRTASDTFATNGTVASPIIFEGFDSFGPDVPSYQGRTNQGALVTTNMPVITYNATYNLTVSGGYVELRGINFTFAANAVGLNTTGAHNVVYQCAVSNSGSGSSAGAGVVRGVYSDSDFTLSGSQSAYCLNTYSSAKIFNCRFVNSSATAGGHLNFNANCAACGNIFTASAGVAINAASSDCTIFGNTFYGQATAVIRTPNSAQAFILALTNNIMTDSGRALLNQYNATAAHPLFCAFNRTRDNTSADLGFGDWPCYNAVTTDTGGPETDFKSAATGDMRLILASPAVSAGPLGTEIGAIPRPKASLPTAAQVQSGVTFGYAQDGLTTGTLAAGVGNVIVIED